MTKDQIIQMARDAGFGNYAYEAADIFERFAAAIRAATKEEDARICEDSQKGDARKQSRYETARKIADAIRASK